MNDNLKMISRDTTYIHIDMQNTTTEMRACVGCKTTITLNNLEKKGVPLKTCTRRRKNDKDINKILQNMYREDNIKQIRDRENLTENLTRNK